MFIQGAVPDSLIKMPLKGTVSQKIRELVKDNKKKGKAKGAGGKARSHKQIVAIALNSK